jgi:hypothetical protein
MVLQPGRQGTDEPHSTRISAKKDVHKVKEGQEERNEALK